MKSPALHVVAPDERAPTVSERIRQMQADLRALNGAQVAQMRAAVAEGVAFAAEVTANPGQPPGVRQAAEQIVRDGEAILSTLDSIVARVG